MRKDLSCRVGLIAFQKCRYVIYLHIHIYACKIMVIALFKNAVVCGCVNTAFDILKVVEHFSVKFKRHLIFLCFNAVSFFPSD